MTLTLILPGLQEVFTAERQAVPAALAKWLSRARQQSSPAECYEQALLLAMQQPLPARADIPGAQCTFVTDFNESAPGFCCRADPVHLQLDKDHARLVPAESLQLAADDAATLIEMLNQSFADRALRFWIGKKDRWYVSGASTTGINSLPTSHVAGRSVSSFLPQSQIQVSGASAEPDAGNAPADDSAYWRLIATEVQMLLHDHPVNQRRQGDGLQPINALWFWGGGKFKAASVASEHKLFSNAAFALGLGQLSGHTVYPLQDILPAIPAAVINRRSSGGRLAPIVVLETRLLEAILVEDTALRAQALDQLAAGLMANAQKHLLLGRIQRIIIDSCDGYQFILDRRALLKFWNHKLPSVLGP